MSRRPVLEDVDDDEIDNMELDIAQFDPNLRTPIAPLRPGPQVTRSQDDEPPLFPNIPNVESKETPKDKSLYKNVVDPSRFTEEEREHLKRFQHIYPCYFDKNRSHREGRRVSEQRAVENPLAKTISDACRQFNLPALLELDKTHPQDFGNPGRVKVLIKDHETDEFMDSRFKSKRALMNAISDYLKEHPTTLESIGPKSGVPLPQDYESATFEPHTVPKVKGFRMNTIVPVHSSLSIKHPMTRAIYDPEIPQPQVKGPQNPKQPKKKIMKIRG